MNSLKKHFLPIAMATMLTACATEQQSTNITSQDKSKTPEASVQQAEGITLSLALGDGVSRSGRSAARYLGGYNDIDNISIDVKSASSGSTLHTVYLNESGGVWSGQVFNIEVGLVYQFDGRAFDNESVMIFSGTSQQSLADGSNTLNLRMDPVADQTVMAIPRITRILAPSSLGTNLTDSVQVEVEGSSGSKLNYQFAAPEGGSFLPAQGTVNMLGTSATLSSDYIAPPAAGVRKSTVEITNEQGIGVKSSFSILVTTVSNPSIAGIQFSPVVSSLVGWRDNDSGSILWTADVSDDGPLDQIRYAWDFTSNDNTSLTPTFVDNTVNPATMQNYSPDISGILSLTVTDDNGTGSSTEITYNINEGHFPEGLVIDKEIVGQFDETLAMVDSDGNAWGSLDSIAGGDVIDNATGAFLGARQTFLSSGNQIWTLDNDSSARALPQTFDNGTAMRLENLEWNFGRAFVASDDRAYFQARVYDNATNQYFGDEPVVADSSGVRLLADLRPGSSDSYPSQFIESGSKLFFTARDSSGQNKLYKLSLGTADNVSVVNGSPAYPNYPQDITIDSDTSGGSKVMFSVNNGGPQQIYITDGDNTTELDNVPSFNMWSAKRLDDVMYFVTNNELHQLPLSTVRLLQAGDTNDNGDVMSTATWTASPSMITPLGSGSSNVSFYDIQKVDGKLYFRIQDPNDYSQRYQWWESDGTAGGSQIMMADSNHYFANSLVEQNGEFLYTKLQSDSCCPSYPNQLWSTSQTAGDNGTMSNTLLATIGSGNNWGYEPQFVAQIPSGKWFFTANDGTTGRELWITDGTPAGTMLLKDIYPGTTSGLNNFQSRVVGNLLYFVADDGFSGAELWVSNGTPAGTLKAKEFQTGMAGSDPKFHSLNGDLYVFANDGSGVKLYKKAE